MSIAPSLRAAAGVARVGLPWIALAVLVVGLAAPARAQSTETTRKAKALVALLADPDPAVNGLAVKALVEMGEDAAPELGRAVLAHDQRGARERVASVLGSLGPKARAAIVPLVRAHADRYTSVREAAESALDRIGPAAAGDLPEVAALVTDENEPIREAAAKSLGRMGAAGAPATDAVIAALAKVDKAGETREAMFDALEKFGAAAAPRLLAQLTHPDEVTRRRIVTTLGTYGPAARPATGPLTRLLDSDASPQVRAAALDALARIVPGDRLLAEAAGRALGDTAPAVRARAITHLGALGPIASPIAGLLADRLNDPDAAIAASAARALGSIGKPAKPIAQALVARLAGDEILRVAAAEALAKLGEPALTALAPALIHADKVVRLAAIGILPKLSAPADKIATALGARLTDPMQDVRLAAADALGAMGAAAVPVVQTALAAPDVPTRLLGLRIAGHLGDAALPLMDGLERAFVQLDPDVKNGARAALGLLAEHATGPTQDRATRILADR